MIKNPINMAQEVSAVNPPASCCFAWWRPHNSCTPIDVNGNGEVVVMGLGKESRI